MTHCEEEGNTEKKDTATATSNNSNSKVDQVLNEKRKVELEKDIDTILDNVISGGTSQHEGGQTDATEGGDSTDAENGVKFPGIFIVYIAPHVKGGLGAGTVAKDPESRLPRQVVFPIGSITKLWTGLMLAHLVANNEMKLEDPVNNYLKSISPLPGDITLKQLVTHTAGLINYPKNLTAENGKEEGLSSEVWAPARGYSLSLLNKCINLWERCMQAEGSAKYTYSNLGLGILALAIQDQQNVTDYTSLLEKLFTKSMNLKHTGSNTSSYMKKVSNLLSKVYNKDKESISLPDMGVLAGAGELFTNGEDMMRLLELLTGNGPEKLKSTVTEFHKILLPKPLSKSQPNTGLAYAVEVTQEEDQTIYSRIGETQGSLTYLRWNPTQQLGVAILTNRGEDGSHSYTKKLREIAQKIYDRLEDKMTTETTEVHDSLTETENSSQFKEIKAWPKGEIPIYFPGEEIEVAAEDDPMGKGYTRVPFTEEERNKVMEICNDMWGEKIKISCKAYSTEPALDYYVTAFQKVQGETAVPCAVNFGFGQAKSMLVLAPHCFSFEPNAVHEMGHVLGMMHEHQRYDRDEAIIVNWKNIKEKRVSAFTQMESRFADGTYRSMKDAKGNSKYPYDLSSIMQYARTEFSICYKAQPKCTQPAPTYDYVKQPSSTPTPYSSISEGDVKYLQDIYGAR